MRRTALACLAAAAALATFASAQAQTQPPLKVGLMLPATGTFAALGDMIERGFKLHVEEQGGKLLDPDCVRALMANLPRLHEICERYSHVVPQPAELH